MRRVLVLGSPGAGKSTFARALAALTGLPLIHLDAHYHLPGWQEPDPAEWDARLDGLIAGGTWIIDGNFGSSLDRRLARADTAILLDYPTLVCLSRLFRRIATLHGTVRPDAQDPCHKTPPRRLCRHSPPVRTTACRAGLSRRARLM